jgi:hypothetical protein
MSQIILEERNHPPAASKLKAKSECFAENLNVSPLGDIDGDVAL